MSTVNANNWTGERISIEILSETQFKVYGETFSITRSDFGAGYEGYEVYKILTREGIILGRVCRLSGEWVALNGYISREGRDRFEAAAQLIANVY